jgi:hypothetical protein
MSEKLRKAGETIKPVEKKSDFEKQNQYSSSNKNWSPGVVEMPPNSNKGQA